MREIIFRGFHKDENGTKTIYLNGEEIKGKWYFGNLSVEHDKTYIFDTTNGYLKSVKEVIPETISQYTGLDDKNGLKIFENDVVLINDDIANMYRIDTKGKVVYVSGVFKVANDNGEDLLKILYALTDINGIFRGKVIGASFNKE